MSLFLLEGLAEAPVGCPDLSFPILTEAVDRPRGEGVRLWLEAQDPVELKRDVQEIVAYASSAHELREKGELPPARTALAVAARLLRACGAGLLVAGAVIGGGGALLSSYGIHAFMNNASWVRAGVGLVATVYGVGGVVLGAVASMLGTACWVLGSMGEDERRSSTVREMKEILKEILAEAKARQQNPAVPEGSTPEQSRQARESWGEVLTLGQRLWAILNSPVGNAAATGVASYAGTTMAHKQAGFGPK